MVTSLEQAAAIQQRRVEAGKKGHAHAVRRYFRRIAMKTPSGAPDWYGVNDLKQSVPYIDPHPLMEK